MLLQALDRHGVSRLMPLDSIQSLRAEAANRQLVRHLLQVAVALAPYVSKTCLINVLFVLFVCALVCLMCGGSKICWFPIWTLG